MAMDLNEVKISLRSLLTSSPKPISIFQLQKDYRDQEGCNIPYRSLGFHSFIHLLQNIKDVLSVPPNPNESSLVSLVVGEKSNHLRMLVVKQKINTKKKKGNSGMNRQCGYHNNNNHYIRSDYHQLNRSSTGYNKFNQSSSSPTGSSRSSSISSYRNDPFSGYSFRNSTPAKNNYVENAGSNSRQSNKSSIDYNQLNQSSSSTIKNDSTGYMTDKLRSDVEKYILENQKTITVAKLKKIVENHPDYPVLNVKKMQDLKDRFEGFLDISDTYVTFKCKSPVIHHNTGVLPSTVPELNTQLKMNEFQVVAPHSKNQNEYGMDSTTDESIESLTDYLDFCKNKSMMRNLQDVYDSKKNSDITKIKLKKNIDDVDTSRVNGIKSELCSSTQINSSDSSNSFLHSTSIMNENVKITLNEDHGIPEKVVFDIARIFNVYSNGVNIKNFKFIYYIVYNTILNPNVFGFASNKELFKVLDNIIEIKNNVLYTKHEFKLSENMDLKYGNEYILSTFYLTNEVKISLNIEQPLLSFNQDKLKNKLLLVEAYNPSLFYLQLCCKIEELDCLMKQMLTFYETEDTKYLVRPKQILPGSFYASSYSSFLNLKQWYRVRVLRKVNTTTVEIIHVDYGTVDTIPMTELRFLNYEFCNLPCQAIHCCLTGYNQLDSIAPEVTTAFLEIINIKKQVFVMIDDHFIFNKQWQILHVTLFQNKSNSEKLENINNELTIWHLKR